MERERRQPDEYDMYEMDEEMIASKRMRHTEDIQDEV
jgi:hypothetical protein